MTTKTLSDDQILSTTMWRVMPLATMCMIIATIDRSNIGYAKLDMATSLGLSEQVFALGASLFSIGYLLFEIPSVMAAHKYGPRVWFARIMFTWGLATLLLAFSQSPAMFFILRFLLGVAEAGLYPGLIFYVTLWFPKSKHPQALAFVTIGAAAGNALGALISGPLLDLHGLLGFASWQWVFLVTGILPILATGLVLRTLRNSPDEADFLRAPDRLRLKSMVEQDKAELPHAKGLISAVTNLRVLGFGAIYAILMTALYGVIYWSPSVVKSFGVSGVQNGMLVALPWLIDIALLLVLPKMLKTRQAVLTAMVGLSLLGAATFAGAVLIESNYIRYAFLLVGIPCISLVLALNWSFPVRMLRGAGAAAAIAAVSMLGNIGGIFGQNGMPAIAGLAGNISAALWVPCACLSAMALGALVVLIKNTRGAVVQPAA